jgi:hypothetical protein
MDLVEVLPEDYLSRGVEQSLNRDSLPLRYVEKLPSWIDTGMRKAALPQEVGVVACTHDWIDTGMRRSWCRHCNANAMMNSTGDWEEVPE